MINNIIKLNTGKAAIIASGTLFSTIDQPASATYCNATKNTEKTEGILEFVETNFIGECKHCVSVFEREDVDDSRV